MKIQTRYFPRSGKIFRIAFLSWIILVVILTHLANLAYSAEVSLTWDPNTEPNLDGYKIYYGFETDNYVFTIDVGDRTSYAVTGLEENRTIYFVATAYDVNGNESDYSKEVVFKAENQPPVADAGPDQTLRENTIANLSGINSSDPEGQALSYFWEQTGGSMVVLSDPEVAQPNFTTPNVGMNGESLSFRLTATDNEGLQSEDDCIVNVSWVNLPPTANADPDQTVDAGDTVTLSALDSSDPDDGITSYLWEQTAGPTVNISNPTELQPTFVAPDAFSQDVSQDVSLTFQLTVEDFGGLRSTDTCVVNVSWTNTPPTADAGPDQTVDDGVTVTLDGSNSSDPDDGIASFRWKQLSGTPVGFLDPSALKANFIVPDGIAEGQSLTFQITVTDIGGLTSQDACTVLISGNSLYEDGEDGSIVGWGIYDNDPTDAVITNVFDDQRQSRVIQLNGSGTSNGYRLRNQDGSPWHNAEKFTIEWSQKFEERFVVYVDVQTTSGQRYISFTPDDYDRPASGEHVYYGLGSLAKDGQWHTFTVDLNLAIEIVQPGVRLIEVNSLLIRGSGSVDDIQLKAK